MAGCSSTRGGGNTSPNNARRWVEKLSNILISPKARKEFYTYLGERNFTEGQNTLKFWEDCNSFLAHDWKSSPNASSPSRDSAQETILKNAKLLVDFAYNHVNFDSGQIDLLYTALESGKEEDITNAIREAQQNAVELLEDEQYSEYSRFLR